MKSSALLLVAAIALAGCSSSKPKTTAEAQAIAAQSLKDALAARAAKDPRAAAKAAERASEAADAAKELLAQPATAPCDAAAYSATAVSAAAARREADLAAEEAQLAALLDTWKAKAYRTTRRTLVTATFKGLALAAGQAGKQDPATLPELVRDLANAASELSALAAGRPPLADGKPDWKAIEADMNAMAEMPPPMTGVVLAVGHLSSGSMNAALYEVEMLNPNPTSPQLRCGYHLLRGVVLSANGMPLLGAQEVEQCAAAADANPTMTGPQLLSTIHLILAYDHCTKRDLRSADLEVVRAMRAWPDNPMTVFLTGERLAADGKYEQAAESLEKSAKGAEHEWIAQKLAARARHVRDKKGDAEPLFSDTGFLCAVMVQYGGDSAKERAPHQLKGLITACQQLGKQLLKN
ncbi:MAG: hypothetical protein LLG01_00375 [Planctomycetaceae bacterium]|nr:hypothetical protein [Planctomycetaceae bacterium]